MRRASRKTKSGELIIPESQVQSSILTLLKRMGIKSNRVNGGQVFIDGINKRGHKTTRTIRCNSINGKSDIECWPFVENELGVRIGIPIYIEVKASHGGKQRDAQKQFEKDMKDRGYYYFIARSVEDTLNGIREIANDIEAKIPGFKMKIPKVRRT